MIDELLQALSVAKDSDERAWVFLHANIQELDSTIQDFLFIAAIPDRLDAPFLAALAMQSTKDAEHRLQRIEELGFASKDRFGQHRLSDETRRVLLTRLRQADPARFRLLNERAAAYLASLDHDDAGRYAAFLCHSMLASSLGRASDVLLIRETFSHWGGGANFATNVAQAYPKLLAEHVNAGRLIGPVPTTTELWKVMLNRTTGARIALALEGNGALCAYHAGVYEALHEAGIEPEWIAGESMGAMVGAVIAGNPIERRIDALRALWATFAQHSWPSTQLFPWPIGDWLGAAYGVPGLYSPSLPGPLAGGTAFYDLSPARATLERYIDFDRLNDREIRFAAGAVNAATGNFTYFDNAYMRIGPEHVLASMALPPGFPAIQIDGQSYWGAALVSSTALQHVLDGFGDRALVVFQPYLLAVSDRLPRSLHEVNAKQRAISLTSRARFIADYYANMQWMRRKLRHVLERLPEDARTQEEKDLLNGLVSQPRVSLVNLVYRRQDDDVVFAPHNFSQNAIAEHWARGRSDTERALGRDVLTPKPEGDGGIAIYDTDMRHAPNAQ